MTIKTVEAETLKPLLESTLEHFTDEDWYRLNVRATELIPAFEDIAGAEPVTINDQGFLLSGFTTLLRAIQFNAEVNVHPA